MTDDGTNGPITVALPEPPHMTLAREQPGLGGGVAILERLDGEHMALLATMAAAPGERLEGTLLAQASRGDDREAGDRPSASVRFKVHRCVRQGASEPPLFRLEGRLLDARRSDRQALAGLLSQRSG